MLVKYKADLSFSCTTEQLGQINEYLASIKRHYDAGEPYSEEILSEVEITTLKSFDGIGSMPFLCVGDNHKAIIEHSSTDILAPVVNLVICTALHIPTIKVDGKVYNVIPDDIPPASRIRNVWVIKYDPIEQSINYGNTEFMTPEYPGQTDVPDPVIGDTISERTNKASNDTVAVAAVANSTNPEATELAQAINSCNIDDV